MYTSRMFICFNGIKIRITSLLFQIFKNSYYGWNLISSRLNALYITDFIILFNICNNTVGHIILVK